MPEIQWEAVDQGLLMALTVMGVLLLASIIAVYMEGSKIHKPLCLILSLFLIFAALVIFIPAIGPWDVKAEGIYDHSEYYKTEEMTSHGSRYDVHHLIVFFFDGRTYELDRIPDIEFTRGTRIKILEKANRIKIVKSP